MVVLLYSSCFERGHKLAISMDRKIQLNSNQAVSIEFDECLSLVTTLLKDSSGRYREKLGKLVVRKKCLKILSGSGYKGLGLANLPLHRLVADFQSQQFNIPLTNNTDAVGRIDVVISSKYVGDISLGEMTDDEADLNALVEPADFADSSSSESKRRDDEVGNYV